MAAATDDTQKNLIESFKDLMLIHPFKKITIKMITDGASVIRPTFYNHFRDKHEMFEVILEEELFNSLYDLVNIDMIKEATKMIFTYFDKNRLFYEKAFQVTGQNSFRSILTNKINGLFTYIVQSKNFKTSKQAAVLTSEQLVEFFAMNITLIIEMWLTGDTQHNVDADEIFKAFIFLMTHNIEDFFEEE